MTPKPIFIVRVPWKNFQGEAEMFSRVLEDIKKELTDYHVLLVVDGKLESTEFELYNNSDATEKDIQEMQNMILEKIEELEEQKEGKIINIRNNTYKKILNRK